MHAPIGQMIERGRGVVGRRIVDHHHLHVDTLLSARAADRLGQELAPVARGDDDRDLHPARTSRAFPTISAYSRRYRSAIVSIAKRDRQKVIACCPIERRSVASPRSRSSATPAPTRSPHGTT